MEHDRYPFHTCFSDSGKQFRCIEMRFENIGHANEVIRAHSGAFGLILNRTEPSTNYSPRHPIRYDVPLFHIKKSTAISSTASLRGGIQWFLFAEVGPYQ